MKTISLAPLIVELQDLYRQFGDIPVTIATDNMEAGLTAQSVVDERGIKHVILCDEKTDDMIQAHLSRIAKQRAIDAIKKARES